MFFSALCVILFLFTVFDLFINPSVVTETTTLFTSVVGVVMYDNADTQKENF